MNTDLINAAFAYLKLGFSVIPVNGKVPAIKSWKEFQDRQPTEAEIKEWFSNLSVTGIGLVTGRKWGLIVFDVEHGQDTSEIQIPLTVSARSGGGGFHYYFRYPKGRHVSSLAHASLGMKADLKSDGGYVVAPPSKHPSGGIYEWILDPSNEMAELPEWLMTKTQEHRQKRPLEEIVSGVPRGERHTDMVRLMGILFYHLPEKYHPAVLEIVEAVNERNKPPLEQGELIATFEDLLERHNSQKVESKEKAPISLKDLLHMPTATGNFLINSLVPEQGITALSGYPSSGKTWILLAIARAVASGESLFGIFPAKKGHVLIVDEENGVGELQRRAKLMSLPEDLDISFYSQQGFKIDKLEDREYLIRMVVENDIKLVIFDPFVAMHSKTENSAEEIQQVMDCLQELNKVGATVLYIHHHRKEGLRKTNAGQMLRGSSAFSGRADSHIAVEKQGDSNEITISQEKLRRGKNAAEFIVELTEGENQVSLSYKGEIDPETKLDEAKSLIVGIFVEDTTPRTRREIIALNREEDIGEKTTSIALHKLVEEGQLKKKKRGKEDLYSLPDIDDESNEQNNQNLDEPENK